MLVIIFLAVLLIVILALIGARRLLSHRKKGDSLSTVIVLPKSDPFKALIEMDQIDKSFDRQKVLNQISLKIQPGETLGILGKSGGGKSVLLQLIVGLLWPDAGEIRFKGKSLFKMNESELLDMRKRVSYVFQSGAVFDFLSVKENIAYPLRDQGVVDENQIQLRVSELLEAVELDEMGNLQCDELSVGSKKQVAIARAIANNPEAILYDEPTTGVDPLIGKSLSRLIRRLNKHHNLTSVVVTHDLQCLATVSDRIILLKNGQIYFEGSLDEFHTSTDRYVLAFIAGKRYHEKTERGSSGVNCSVSPP